VGTIFANSSYPDLLDESWFKALMPLLWRGVIPTVLLLDTASFEQPNEPSPTTALEPKPVGLTSQLDNFGVNSYVITRDLLDKAEARPGRVGKLEWRVTPRGRAVPINQPADLDWRSLS
jgi:hypothetical protein